MMRQITRNGEIEMKTKGNSGVGCLILVIFGIVVYFATSLGRGGIHANDPEFDAWVCAQQAVEEYLKAPKTADYPVYDDSYVTSLGGKKYRISSYVESENGFGVPIKSYFVVTLELTDTGFKNFNVSFI